MCHAVLPGMIEQGGAIVNTVSTAGVIGQPYSAAYSASKGGVKLLTKALAVEYMARRRARQRCGSRRCGHSDHP